MKTLMSPPKWTGKVERAIYLLQQARELLERTTEEDLTDAADDISPILSALEDWQARNGATET